MLVNLNDHEIIVTDGEMQIVYPRSRKSMRMEQREETICTIDGIPVVQMVYECSNNFLPEKKEGVYYIVPKVVRDLYASSRDDLISPGTNPGVDGAVIGKGKIKCVRRFRLPDRLLVKE